MKTPENMKVTTTTTHYLEIPTGCPNEVVEAVLGEKWVLLALEPVPENLERRGHLPHDVRLRPRPGERLVIRGSWVWSLREIVSVEGPVRVENLKADEIHQLMGERAMPNPKQAIEEFWSAFYPDILFADAWAWLLEVKGA